MGIIFFYFWAGGRPLLSKCHINLLVKFVVDSWRILKSLASFQQGRLFCIVCSLFDHVGNAWLVSNYFSCIKLRKAGSVVFCTKLLSKRICVLYPILFCIKLVEVVDSAVYFLFCLLVGGCRTGGCVSISPHFNADTLHILNLLF